MLPSSRKSVVVGLAAIGLSLGWVCSAQAGFLPVQNLTFDNFSGSAPKNNFSAVNPSDWFRGTPAGISDLVFIDAPNIPRLRENLAQGSMQPRKSSILFRA